MRQLNKKIGVGSISLLLCTMGILFAFSFGDKGCYGDNILKFIGLNPWSNDNRGLHYTLFYSLIFFIPAFILSYKFKNNLGAKLGNLLSLVMLLLMIVVVPLFVAS